MRSNMLKKLLSVAIVLFLPLSVLAQTGTISGTITDAATGETLPGASVLVTETASGASTDLNGEYTISNLAYGTYTLRVTYVGYQTVTRSVEVNQPNVTVNFELSVDMIGLDELVISGYGVQTKREITGAISTVRARDIENVPLQNVESLLQGRAAGVNITSVSGNPGGAFRVQVRGNGSINSATEPLYVIDGVPVSFSNTSGLASTSPLNSINPSDIESIEILKDAAAAAIYGSQAAAGVVIINTKRGSTTGVTRVTARAETGVRSTSIGVNYLDRDEYLDYLGEARAFQQGIRQVSGNEDFIATARENRVGAMRNAFGSTITDPDNPLFGDPLGRDLANTSWQDEIYDTGVSQKYNISVSGGDQTTRFFLSGAYEDTEGHVFRDRFTRFNVRSNVSHNVNDRLSTSLNMNVGRSTQFGICQGGNFTNCPTSQANFIAPFFIAQDDEGNYLPHPSFGLAANPLVTANEVDRDVTVWSIFGDVNVSYQLTDWLSVRGLSGLDFRTTEDRRYDNIIAQPGDGGSLSHAFREVINHTHNLVFNANQTFNDVHNVSGLIGTEYRRNYSEVVSTRGIGFPGTFFGVLNASSEAVSAAGTFTEFRVGSYFGNFKYNFDEKYYISFIARYDGHSRFGADTRWGFFPAISGSWRVSEEDFWTVDVIDEFRVRAGFGLTGNAAIGNFASRGLYSAVGSYLGATALTPTQLANVNLGWEEAQEINIGFDLSFLDGRISTAIDIYQKDNKDLLFARNLPSDSGFLSITENVGSVRNEGIEFEINSVNVNTTNFVWSSRFNISFMRNEILELPNGETINPNSIWEQLEEGRPIGQIFAARYAGVNPADGRPMWYDIDGNITYTPGVDDRIYYEDGQANQVGGFGNTLSYRGFTLDAFFQFSFGQWAMGGTDWYFVRQPQFTMNLDDHTLDRWQNPGDMTYVPHAVITGAQYAETADFRTTVGTHAFYNASYIRLKNVSFSYDAPRALANRIGVNNLRLFVSGVNLMTWTAWPYYDPEVAFNTIDIFGNFTAASYPTARQINGGIEIQF